MSDYIDNSLAVQRLTKDLVNAAKLMTPQEARFLVDQFYISQDNRIRYDGQVRAMVQSGEPNLVLTWMSLQSSAMEAQIKRALDKFTDEHPVGAWIKGLFGFGPVLAAGLVAHIDIEQAPTAGHIWSYAGIVPGKEWVSRERSAAWVKENGLDHVKAALDFNRNPENILAMATHDSEGNKIEMTAKSLAAAISRRPWNPELKKLCFKIGECMVKFANNEECHYGHIYRERKLMEWDRNLGGVFTEQAKMDAERYGRSTEAYLWTGGYYKAEDVRKMIEKGVSLTPDQLKKIKGEKGSGTHMLPPAHIHARARRYAVKIFLSHLHEVWYETHFKRRVPNPFVIEHMGHVHRIKVPNYTSPYDKDVPSAVFKVKYQND